MASMPWSRFPLKSFYAVLKQHKKDNILIANAIK